jgi:adenylate kinase
MKKVFVVLGPSGSGKGTQAQILSEKLNLPSLSMGQIMRDLIASGDELGIKAKEYMDNGQWVPVEITVKALKNAVINLQNGFIIDGFPRLFEQVINLEDILKEIDAQLGVVIHFDISDETSMERMMKRVKEEEASGKIREDQKPEIMLKRLKSYHDTVEPILDYYQEKGVLERVNGEPTVEEIALDIENRLKTRGLLKN